MQTLESAGKFWTKEIRDLNEMYNGNLPPEAKKIILQRFGKYIKGVDVAKL
jgi:hypothetical protein